MNIFSSLPHLFCHFHTRWSAKWPATSYCPFCIWCVLWVSLSFLIIWTRKFSWFHDTFQHFRHGQNIYQLRYPISIQKVFWISQQFEQLCNQSQGTTHAWTDTLSWDYSVRHHLVNLNTLWLLCFYAKIFWKASHHLSLSAFL